MTMCDQCDMSTAAAAAIMPHASCQPQHRRHAHHRTTRRRRAVSPCTRAPVLPLPLPLPQRISVNDRNGQLQKRKEVEIYICCIEMSLRVTYVSRVTKTSSYSLAVPVPVMHCTQLYRAQRARSPHRSPHITSSMHNLIINSHFGSKLLAARLPRTPPA